MDRADKYPHAHAAAAGAFILFSFYLLTTFTGAPAR